MAAAVVPAAPFARSGTRVRSGYDLVRTAGSAGLLEGRVGRLAVVAIALLPLLAAGAVVAASLRGRRSVATLAVMVGLVSGGAGAMVVQAPVRAEVGATWAIVVGAVCVLAGAACAWPGPRGGTR